jgi:hypothetical protein
MGLNAVAPLGRGTLEARLKPIPGEVASGRLLGILVETGGYGFYYGAVSVVVL